MCSGDGSITSAVLITSILSNGHSMPISEVLFGASSRFPLRVYIGCTRCIGRWTWTTVSALWGRRKKPTPLCRCFENKNQQAFWLNYVFLFLAYRVLMTRGTHLWFALQRQWFSVVNARDSYALPQCFCFQAERIGFEPMEPLRVRRFSRPLQ